MKVHDSHLCIGGPWDGQRTDQPPGREMFRVPLPLPIEFVFGGPLPDVSTSTVEYATYHRVFYYCGPDDAVTLWVAEPLSTLDVFTRLLDRYQAKGAT